MDCTQQPNHYLETALRALRENRGDWRAVLDALPVPVYMIDAEGEITYCNQACVEFAGRRPQVGQDRWSVTWPLSSLSGESIPQDECSMARAVRTGQPVEDTVVVAMRPEGSRRAFSTYATPLLDSSGTVTGAINLLIDVTEEQTRALAEQASRCRRLCHSTTDPQAARVLASMADDYSAAASALLEPH